MSWFGRNLLFSSDGRASSPANMMNRPEFHGPNLENHPHYDPAPVPGASAWAIGVIGLGGGFAS
jgi:hypothetical protein